MEEQGPDGQRDNHGEATWAIKVKPKSVGFYHFRSKYNRNTLVVTQLFNILPLSAEEKELYGGVSTSGADGVKGGGSWR